MTDKIKKWIVDLFLLIFSIIVSIALDSVKRGFLIQYGYPLGLNIALMGTSFICAGSLFKRVMEIEEEKYILPMTVVCFFLSLSLYKFNLPSSVTEGFPHVEMAIGSYGNRAIFYLVAICGSCFVIGVSKLIKQSSIIERIGKNTIAILGTHGMVISVLVTLFSKFIVSDVIMFLSVIMFTTAIELIISEMVNRFIPNLNGK